MRSLSLSIAVIWAVFLVSGNCVAEENSKCSNTLSLAGKPSFEGLTSTKFKMDSPQGSEGGEMEVLADAQGHPVYIVINEFGETGKKVSLYKLSNSNESSFVARVSEYRYAKPIYIETARVVSIKTDSFIVCHGQALNGVGEAIDRDLVADSVDDVEKAKNAFLEMRRN